MRAGAHREPAESRFVGRGEELAALDAAIYDAAEGRGRCILVAGPPGIGKSRLLDRAEAMIESRGSKLSRARCWEEGGAPPFWPWTQIVDAIRGRGSPRAAPDETGHGALTPGEGRFAIFRRLTEVLVRASKAEPRAVVIDDLHAADPASLVMLQFFAMAIREERIVFLGAYRDTEVAADPAQAARFADLGRDVKTIHLRGLEKTEIAQWFGERLGVPPKADVLDALVERTAGNPLFIDGIFRSITATGGFAGADGFELRRIALPPELGSAVRGWVGRLSANSRRLLEAAAAIGIEFEVDVLAVVTERAVDDVLSSLREASEIGILAPEAAPYRRRFGHALIHDALLRSLGDDELRRLDHRIVDVLRRRRIEDEEAAATRIAHQLVRSVDAGILGGHLKTGHTGTSENRP